eukprot:UN24374
MNRNYTRSNNQNKFHQRKNPYPQNNSNDINMSNKMANNHHPTVDSGIPYFNDNMHFDITRLRTCTSENDGCIGYLKNTRGTFTGKVKFNKDCTSLINVKNVKTAGETKYPRFEGNWNIVKDIAFLTLNLTPVDSNFQHPLNNWHSNASNIDSQGDRVNLLNLKCFNGVSKCKDDIVRLLPHVNRKLDEFIES